MSSTKHEPEETGERESKKSRLERRNKKPSDFVRWSCDPLPSSDKMVIEEKDNEIKKKDKVIEGKDTEIRESYLNNKNSLEFAS